MPDEESGVVSGIQSAGDYPDEPEGVGQVSRPESLRGGWTWSVQALPEPKAIGEGLLRL